MSRFNYSSMSHTIAPFKAALSALFLVGCMSGCFAQTKPVILPSPASPASQVTPKSPTPLTASTSPVAQSFQFPQPSCGDKSAGNNETWYPVFINAGDVEKLRTQFCADAITTTRKDTGDRAVQLASFTESSRATAFAQAVGGSVGAPTTATELIEAAKPARQLQSSKPRDEEAAVQSATLTSQEPDSPINVRDDAGPQAYARHIAYAGDSVNILHQKLGSDGHTWYYTSFHPGVEGWIQGDYVVLNTHNARSTPLEANNSSVDSSISSNIVETITPYSSSGSKGAGICDYPEQLDSAGRRCGERAASERPGGRLGGSSSYNPSSSGASSGSVYVHGYTRRDGTYVHSHTRSRSRR